MDGAQYQRFRLRLFQHETDQRPSLCCSSGEHIKNLTIERRADLRIERHRSNERHFLLRQEWHDLLLDACDHHSRQCENLLVFNQLFDIRARDRVRVNCDRFEFKLATVNAALRINFSKRCGDDVSCCQRQFTDWTNRRKRYADHDLVFSESRIDVSSQTLEIDHQIVEIFFRHLIPRHHVKQFVSGGIEPASNRQFDPTSRVGRMLASIDVRDAIRLCECFPLHIRRTDPAFNFSLPCKAVAVCARHYCARKFEGFVSDVRAYFFTRW